MDRKATKRSEYGITLVELLWVMAIMTMATVLGVGAMARIMEQACSQSVVTKVKSTINFASTQAVMKRCCVGVVFESGESGITANLFIDGDGDGVNRVDIRRGTDVKLGSRILLDEGKAFVGIPEAVRKGPGGESLDPSNPVRFGRGDILTFSPTATATPGSLYITDASGTTVWAFRVSGLGGRVRIYRWFKGKWSRMG